MAWRHRVKRRISSDGSTLAAFSLLSGAQTPGMTVLHTRHAQTATTCSRSPVHSPISRLRSEQRLDAYE